MSAADWAAALHPAACAKCRASFLVPATAGAPWCPNCFAARLEPIPALADDAPPELIVLFNVADATLQANLDRWTRSIPFKPDTLKPQVLRANLARVFVPMYLADARVWGSWNAQMGFDYLVASSEERYSSGGWVTQRLNETRIRWEPRTGDLSRLYENVPAPALENHVPLMTALGDAKTFPFDTSRAVPFTPDATGNAIVRAPEIKSEAAWQAAKIQVERRAAAECQTASAAQHNEHFILRAAFGEPHWTLLLLPMYVTAYADDDHKLVPIRINGQSGAVSGVKRASLKNALRWSLLLAGIALLSFFFTVLIALSSAQFNQLTPLAAVLLFITLGMCLAAPVPLIIVWQYNHAQIK